MRLPAACCPLSRDPTLVPPRLLAPLGQCPARTEEAASVLELAAVQRAVRRSGHRDLPVDVPDLHTICRRAVSRTRHAGLDMPQGGVQQRPSAAAASATRAHRGVAFLLVGVAHDRGAGVGLRPAVSGWQPRHPAAAKLAFRHAPPRAGGSLTASSLSLPARGPAENGAAAIARSS